MTVLQTIKKYSLPVQLNQHIKQLRIYRNSKEINLAKLNSRISVEVLTLPVAAEPTLRATVHAQFAVTTQCDCLEEQFCFASTWFCGPLSLVAMFRYIRFPQIMHGKHIGNRNDKRFEKTRYTE